MVEILEARVGIEPTHKGFADLSLTTWVPRLNPPSIAKFFGPCQRRAVTGADDLEGESSSFSFFVTYF